MTSEKRENTAPSLFDQTKDFYKWGERLSGDAEILHEIQDEVALPACRPQIQKVLESVPDVFAEDWESPESFSELSAQQQEVYREIAQIGPVPLTGPEIQAIIECGVTFKNRPQT